MFSGPFEGFFWDLVSVEWGGGVVNKQVSNNVHNNLNTVNNNVSYYVNNGFTIRILPLSASVCGFVYWGVVEPKTVVKLQTLLVCLVLLVQQ